MKGSRVLFILLIILLAGGLVYWLLVANNNETNSIESPKSFSETHTNSIAADKEIKKAKLDLSKEKQDEVLLSEAESCEELNRLCPECKLHWDDLVADIISIGEEAGSSGPFSLMPNQNLVSLADSGNSKAMFYHGVNLVWEGAIGIRFLRPNDTGRLGGRTTGEIVRSHSLDIEKIELGEEYLYKAALKGNGTGWLEIQNAMSMAFNKAIKSSEQDEQLIRTLIAKHYAIDLVAREIYRNDSVYFDIYLGGLIPQSDNMLKKWKKDALEEELQKEQKLLKGMTKSLADKYLKRWRHDREYLGEAVYPKVFDESFAVYYEQAFKLCAPDYE